MFKRWINIAIIAVFAVLSAVSVFFLLRLEFNYDFESFFPKSSADMAFYNRYREQFGPDDNHILIGLGNRSSGSFDLQFLKKIDSFTREAGRQLPHIISASSLPVLKIPILAAGTLIRQPLIHLNDPGRLRDDSLNIIQDERLRNRYISSDGSVMAVILNTSGTLTLKQAKELDEGLNRMLDNYHFEDFFIAGRAYYQSLFAKRAKDEFVFYSSLSTIIILIILFLIFRKPWGILVSFSSVLVGMLIFIGFLGLRGKSLDPMSNLFPILMIIVGVSDVIHLLTKYTLEQRKGMKQRAAIRKTIREVGLATFLTSLTTAIGFSSLYTSSVPPIRNFGVTASIGVFIAYFTVLLFSSSLMSLFPAEKLIRINVKKNNWDRITSWFYRVTLNHQRKILIFSLLAIVVFIAGISKISTDTHIENNFPRDAKIRSDFILLEEAFGGVRNFEIAVLAAPGKLIKQSDILRNIEKVERYLAGISILSSPISPVSLYKSVNRALHGNSADHYKLPEEDYRLRRLDRYVRKIPDQIGSSMISKDGTMGRMMFRFRDVGSDSIAAIRQNIDSWVAQNTDTAIVKFRQTGTALLFDTNTKNVRSNMFFGLGIAFLLVSLLMVMLFKNWKMVFISLVPNIFPLLLGGALLGFLGIELDAATSIIFAIAFGIAVDDTIHFLSKFRLEIDQGKTIKESIRITFHESGKAICLTSIILFFGFISLSSSYYPPTFYVGLLVSITLLSALLADLFLTPVLIYQLMGTGEMKLKSWFRKLLRINGKL